MHITLSPRALFIIYRLHSGMLKFRKLEEPVLSRWWLVGACATSFKECKLVWEKICAAIRNSAPSTSAANKIASCTLNLIQKIVIINDLELMIAFHKAFIFPHFQFLQIGDPKTGGTPSFLGRHCTVRLLTTLNVQ